MRTTYITEVFYELDTLVPQNVIVAPVAIKNICILDGSFNLPQVALIKMTVVSKIMPPMAILFPIPGMIGSITMMGVVGAIFSFTS